jgi:lysozyme family protein
MENRMNQQPLENAGLVSSMQTCDFGRACAILLPIERGESADDNGAGAVNWGITQRFLTLIGDGRTPNHLSWEDAKGLYKEYYWEPWRLGEIHASSQAIADYVFGLLVNTTPQQVVMQAQLAVNAAGDKTVKVDGRIGPATLAALNGCDVEQFKRTFYHLMRTWYLGLGDNPRNAKYAGGWLNRNTWFYLHSGKDPAQVPQVFDPKLLADFKLTS